MTEEIEIWRDLDPSLYPNHYNYYKISNKGRVLGPKGKILSPGKRGKYLGVHFKVNGLSKSTDIHRLVAQHFVSNPFNLPEVNHEDGNTLNNNAFNLKWVSSKDNMKHAIETGLRNDFGSNSKNSKLTEEDVIFIRTSTLPSKELAKRFNVHRDYLNLVKNNKRWKHLSIAGKP